MKDLEKLKYFLGTEITRFDKGLVMSLNKNMPWKWF